jgi:predicted PurR-regulated permease PerM
VDKDLPPSRTVVQPNILPGRSATGTHSLAVFVVVIAALYFGRDVFLPLALAGPLSFALAPLIAALRRRGIPRTPAVLTVVVCAFVGIFVFGFVVAGQVSELGASLPRYEYNIREKVRSLQSSAPGGGFVERAGGVLRVLLKDIGVASFAPAVV